MVFRPIHPFSIQCADSWLSVNGAIVGTVVWSYGEQVK